MTLTHFFCTPVKSKKRSQAKRLRADFLICPRDVFEEAMLSGELVRANFPASPPWTVSDQHCDNEKTRAVVSARLKKIRSAVDDPKLFLKEDLTKALNAYAAKWGANQSEFRFWFCAYCVFGQRGLRPRYENCGRWVRDGTEAKMGRTSLSRGRSGFSMNGEAKAKMTDGYWSHYKLGRPFTAIYRDVIRHNFNCRVRKTSDGHYEIYHPKGERFPSERQFIYHIKKNIGSEVVGRNRFGVERWRNKKTYSTGSFSQATSNIMERGEADAEVADVASIFKDCSLPPIVTVRLVDTMSAMPVGLGFSPSNETTAAYRAALFCAAIPKSIFGRLFGLEIHEADWPCVGVPAKMIFDRGAGSVEPVAETLKIREMSPSYSGQSKAVVEASHARVTRMEGQPMRLSSGRHPIELAREKITATLGDVHADDASSRLTPEMIAAGVSPTPNGIWTYCDERGRNDAQHYTLTDAVQEFLPKITLRMTEKGALLNTIFYRSQDQVFLDAMAKAQRYGRYDVEGYVLEMCTRYLWLRLDDRLLEVEGVLPVLADTEQLFMTLTEMEAMHCQIAVLKSSARGEAQAARAYFEARHETVTGEKYNNYTVSKGKRPVKKKGIEIAAAHRKVAGNKRG